MPQPLVKLNESLLRDLREFERTLRQWDDDVRRDMRRAHGRIGQRWRTEAVKRVPVDEGRVKNAIVSNVYEANGTFYTEVGTNVEYALYLEFGTEHIAGGAVKALGDRVDISDAEAIKSWPAKDAELPDVEADAQGRYRDSSGRFLAGVNSKEQMPWLRPSFTVMREWAIAEFDAVLEPPKQQGV